MNLLTLTEKKLLYCIEEIFSRRIKMIEYKVKVYKNGTKKWFLNEVFHREDGPAIEYVEIGHRYWYLKGKRHREDGPAVEESNGYKEWWINGNLHREDGPAIEYANGNKLWYLNGKLHREGGPAVEYFNGDKLWYLNGKNLTEEEFINKNSHTLVIDGKELIISNDSFNELKKFFKGE